MNSGHIIRDVEYHFPLNIQITSDHGLTAGTFLLEQHGEFELPLFSSKHTALDFIINRKLYGHEPAIIEGDDDITIIVEKLRKKGGRYVRIDDPDGQSAGVFCPEIDSFLEYLKATGDGQNHD